MVPLVPRTVEPFVKSTMKSAVVEVDVLMMLAVVVQVVVLVQSQSSSIVAAAAVEYLQLKGNDSRVVI